LQEKDHEQCGHELAAPAPYWDVSVWNEQSRIRTASNVVKIDETRFEWHAINQKAAMLIAEALIRIAQQQSDSHTGS